MGDDDHSESPTLYLDFGAGFWSERRGTGWPPDPVRGVRCPPHLRQQPRVSLGTAYRGVTHDRTVARLSIAWTRQVTVTNLICGVDVSSATLEARLGRDGPVERFAHNAAGVAGLAAFTRSALLRRLRSKSALSRFAGPRTFNLLGSRRVVREKSIQGVDRERQTGRCARSWTKPGAQLRMISLPLEVRLPRTSYPAQPQR